MSKLILATVGISVINNYLKRSGVTDIDSELEGYRAMNVEIDKIKMSTTLTETERNQKILCIIQEDVDNIFKDAKLVDAFSASGEVKSLSIFRNKRGFNESDKIILLHSNTYEGYVAAYANKKLLVNYQLADERQIDIDCLISETENGVSFRIDEFSNEDTIDNGLDILKKRFYRYSRPEYFYNEKYACLTGGYKIECLAAFDYSREFRMTPFLNHERNNDLHFF